MLHCCHINLYLSAHPVNEILREIALLVFHSKFPAAHLCVSFSLKSLC